MAKEYSLSEFDQQFPDTPIVPPKPVVPAAAGGNNQYGAILPATGTETPAQAGLKAAVNYPSSIVNFGKGVVDLAKTAVKNPVSTAKYLAGLASEINPTNLTINTAKKAIGLEANTPYSDKAKEVMGTSFNQRYGTSFGPEKFDLDKFIQTSRKTAIEDPFGVGSDILGAVTGVAGLAGKTSAVNNAISKTAQVVTSPVSKTTSAVTNAVTGSARFGISQATGLSPQTIKTITQNPRAFSAAQAGETSRLDLADDVLGAVQKASDELSDLGSGYQSIRESGATVSLPENWLGTSLDKYGLKLNNGRITADKASRTRNATDISKIQNFVDNWGDARTLTADEYLNMRHDLSEIAKYDMAGSDVARQFGTSVREGVLNADNVRGQVPGLKDLDAVYSEDINFYKSIKKDLLKEDGTFKDGAASKIVNSINAANPERLARLEKLYPGFTQQAKVIKAVEDVEAAMGLKVGAYIRAGAALTGVATGNVPLIVSSILAVPEVAVPLLKGYGYTAETVGPILKVIRETASDINNFRTPGAVERYLKEKYPDGVPVGLSVQTTEGKALRQIDFVDKAGRKQSLRLPIDEAKDYLAKLDADGIKYSVTTPDKTSFSKGATPQTTALLEEAKKYKSAEEFVRSQPVVYHGSPVPLKRFSNKKGGVFFTEEYGDATGFAGSPDNVYEGYLNFKKPLEIDAKGAKWDEIDSKWGNSTVEINSKAQKAGYDGVIFRNVIDNIADDAEVGMPGNIYYAMKPEDAFLNESQLEDIWKQANRN